MEARIVSQSEGGDDAGWSFEPGEAIAPHKQAIARLGGGMRTETWLAWDVARWAPVVVKIARPDQLQSEKALAGLQREAEAHRTLHHPAIQRMLEDRSEASVPHLVMEYIQGPALGDVVHEHGQLLLVDVVRLGLQICSVLHYLHTQGRLHLDIKPDNVVLRAGQAVVIDLGFVRAIGWAPTDGYPRGSRPYMAPEQCRCEPVAPSTDLFALGAVLYELATGEPAFRSTHDCFEQLERRASSARCRTPELPTQLDDIIFALLEPDIANRPCSAAHVLRALDAVMPPDEDHVWPEFATQLLAT